MCNDFRNKLDIAVLEAAFRQLDIPLSFPEGLPNLEPRDDIRITDRAAIVRWGPAGAELVQRRWSWPGQGGKPVYNFRGDGREFRSGRCLIVADGFYEFTTPADPKQKRKDRWLFRPRGEGLLCIAGLVRDDPGRGEAFTMLTTQPGPDVAPYHGRQVALLRPGQWRTWLTYAEAASALLGPAPAGTLEVSAANAA
ncbi:MAG: hypothetical protein QOH86_1406 [Sphingomonadales bacterium]|nr:hypothetical protein [Sphingomonadales bacterium]